MLINKKTKEMRTTPMCSIKKESKTVTTNFSQVKKFLSLFYQLDVSVIEARAFNLTDHKTISKQFSTDDNGINMLCQWIQDNDLTERTINCTFNMINDDSLNKSGFIKDSDIESYRFLFIDVDSVKKVKGESATAAEKKAAVDLAKKILDHLKEEGFSSPIVVDSGNGTHIFIPVERNKALEAKKVFQSFLKVLSGRYSNGDVQVDTSVFNPSRLCKLVGTPATKGTSTEERPYRPSTLLEVPNEIIDTPISAIEKYVNKYDMRNNGQSNTRNIRNPYESETQIIYADAEKWLAHYNLSFHTKDGDIEGMKLLILDQCPLDVHSNNQNGSSISMSKEGICNFRCLHESHKDKNIGDFATKYPIPPEAYPNVIEKEIPTISGLEEGKQFVFDEFILLLDGVYKFIKGARVKIADAMFISRVFMEEETNITKYRFHYRANNKWHEKVIDAGLVQLSGFRSLTKINVTFKAGHEMAVVDFLNTLKSLLPLDVVKNEVGWGFLDDDVTYQSSYLYSKKNKLPILSSENSALSFEQKGSFEEYSEFVKKKILGTNLEMAICIAFGAICAGYLKAVGVSELVNVIVSVCGLSATGKTTLMFYIASFMGNPRRNMRTMNATQAAIIKMATRKHGTVLLLDEAGATGLNDLSSLFYSLALGEERLRLTKDSNLKSQEQFEVLTCISSEQKMKSLIQGHSGLQARFIEFQDITWTKSAKQSDDIKRFVANHYGVAYDAALTKLFEIGPEHITEWFDECKQALQPHMEEHHLKSRILNNLAILRVGGMMAKKVLDWEMSMDLIDELLLQSYANKFQQDDDATDDPYESICQYIVGYSSKFIIQGNHNKNFSGFWGKITFTDTVIKVNIIPLFFKKMVKNLFNVSDPTSIIHQLKEGGNISAEKDRNTKRVRINKEPVVTYELLLSLDYKPYFSIGAKLDSELPTVDTSFLLNPTKFLPTKDLFLTDETGDDGDKVTPDTGESDEKSSLDIDENF
ncbi:DUF927 domain-containing protein [Enterococcus asini]|uniref:DUF927 domain-containing protein n=1 Tax=Enterococcus asini TaxID=57732 RepID=UPI00241DDA10|nr:DUF927 domain-containing protein [Enterococcus asini]